MRSEAEEDFQEIETFMNMLEEKFGQDMCTEALKKYNEYKGPNRTDVLQEQAAWQALHGNLPRQPLTRSVSFDLGHVGM